MGRMIDVGPAEFACVRAVLKLSQGEFAERLGLSRRTVIRGEQRGIELPPTWGQPAGGLRDKWHAAAKEAEADRERYVEAAKSDTIAKILEKVAQDTTRQGYSYYGKNFADQFREKVAQLAGDIKTRAKLSQGAARKPAKKSKRKLARRKK